MRTATDRKRDAACNNFTLSRPRLHSALITFVDLFVAGAKSTQQHTSTQMANALFINISSLNSIFFQLNTLNI